MSEAVRGADIRTIMSGCQLLVKRLSLLNNLLYFLLLNWREDLKMIFLQCYSIFHCFVGFKVFIEKVRVQRALVWLAKLSWWELKSRQFLFQQIFDKNVTLTHKYCCIPDSKPSSDVGALCQTSLYFGHVIVPVVSTVFNPSGVLWVKEKHMFMAIKFDLALFTGVAVFAVLLNLVLFEFDFLCNARWSTYVLVEVSQYSCVYRYFSNSIWSI